MAAAAIACVASGACGEVTLAVAAGGFADGVYWRVA